MSVTITFIADDVGSVRGEMRQLLIGDAGFFMVASPKSEQLTAEPVPEAERKEFPSETPRKARAVKTRPVELEEVAVPEVAAEPEAPLPEPAADAAEPSAESTPSTSSSADIATDAKPEFSEDDVRKALVDLGSQANGKENCRAVLSKFNATKLSEIKVDDRKAFIAEIAKLRGVAA